MKKIIAVFGGSFNPPNTSHFYLANQILAKCKNVEKIIFVPVNTNYNKNGLIENKHRYEMLKLGCQNQPNFDVSDIELKSEKQPFTIDTLNKIKDQYKNNLIYFILGTDNLKELETWHKSEELVKKFKFFVLERNNDNLEKLLNTSKFLSRNKNSFIKLEGIPKINLSSTLIREKIKNKEDVDKLLSKKIKKYIEKNNLYNN